MTTKSFLLTLFLAAPLAHAMEIPLQHGSAGEKGGDKASRIGFVDMDRIYQEFPETGKAREEYQRQADKVKQALVDKESELADLREQISVLKAASEAPAASTETAPAPLPSGDLEEKERLLADEETALQEAKEEASAILTEFERRRAAQIFGKLYKSLVQLADEKGVDLVLDKSALLYGQGGLDLTEALSRRVRGLPDAEDVP
jgi:Skp family chaperone for outer membrane proteins